ncbi:MAG TPA: hypothetical protein VEG63_08815 [Candidatus Acidoferrales bacterium]|nr:hypothetical protein [Candidatus Acidoferrales bacterium]
MSCPYSALSLQLENSFRSFLSFSLNSAETNSDRPRARAACGTIGTAMSGGSGYEQLKDAARTVALHLSAALGGGGLAARFILDYAERYRRAAITAHLPRYTELVSMIHRECLLAMVARVEADIPRVLRAGGTPARALASGEDPLLRRFRVEFYEHLAELLGWRQEQLDRFWHDLDLYMQCQRAQSAAPAKKKDLGPFADRCGFMLDPSMLERARRAAARFHDQLEAKARKILRSALRPQ